MPVSERHLWLTSGLVSLALVAVLIFLWAEMNQFGVQGQQQLVDARAVTDYIEKNWEAPRRAAFEYEPTHL